MQEKFVLAENMLKKSVLQMRKMNKASKIRKSGIPRNNNEHSQ